MEVWKSFMILLCQASTMSNCSVHAREGVGRNADSFHGTAVVIFSNHSFQFIEQFCGIRCVTSLASLSLD